jgi:hypothetical protein
LAQQNAEILFLLAALEVVLSSLVELEVVVELKGAVRVALNCLTRLFPHLSPSKSRCMTPRFLLIRQSFLPLWILSFVFYLPTPPLLHTIL